MNEEQVIYRMIDLAIQEYDREEAQARQDLAKAMARYYKQLDEINAKKEKK